MSFQIQPPQRGRFGCGLLFAIVSANAVLLIGIVFFVIRGCAPNDTAVEIDREEPMVVKKDDEEPAIKEKIEKSSNKEGLPKHSQKTKSDNNDPKPRKTENQKEEPGWIEADKREAARIGDVIVALTAIGIKKVALHHLGQAAESNEEYLLVVVGLASQNANKKIEYRTWSKQKLLSGNVKLTDEFKNEYRQIDFGFGTDIVGQHKNGATIYSGKIIEDILVFQKPIENAKLLFLELPASNFEEKGTVRIKITKTLYTPKIPDPKPKPKSPMPPPKPPAPPPPALNPEQKAAKEEADASRKLRLAKPFIESNQKDIARRRLEEIIREYPRTKAAVEAKELLEKLR